MNRPDLHCDRTERRRRAATVKAWREQYGDWCPGYLVAAHGSGDLTADHVQDVGAGGDPRGDLTVLCRSCNTRKRNVVQAKLRQPQSPHAVVRSRAW